MRIAIVITLMSLMTAGFGAELSNGKVSRNEQGALQAWDNVESEWIDIENFWTRYADRKGGLTWGRKKEYPGYDNVKEFDTIIIELDQGPCLMEFFHSRWRRANDVRRWDDAFNGYGGCPYVFD